jgi:hypothetical protein
VDPQVAASRVGSPGLTKTSLSFPLFCAGKGRLEMRNPTKGLPLYRFILSVCDLESVTFPQVTQNFRHRERYGKLLNPTPRPPEMEPWLGRKDGLDVGQVLKTVGHSF